MATGKVNQRVNAASGSCSRVRPRRLPLSVIVLASFFDIACPKVSPVLKEFHAPEIYIPERLMQYVTKEGEHSEVYNFSDFLLYKEGKVKKVGKDDEWKITFKIPEEDIPKYICQKDYKGNPNVTFKIFVTQRKRDWGMSIEAEGLHDVGFNTMYLGTDITKGTGYWGTFYQGCDEEQYRDQQSISDGENQHLAHHFFSTLERLIEEGRVERVSP